MRNFQSALRTRRRSLLGSNIRRLTEFLLFTLLTYATPASTLLTRTGTSRSSPVMTTDDHVITGYVIQRQWAYDFLSCAQLCLAHSACESFNYENIKYGLCELNSVGLNGKTGKSSAVLSAKTGFSFGQLMNISDQGLTNHGNHNEQQFNFGTLTASGRTGPSDTSGYVGTSLEGKVNLTRGIQIWTVPVTGSYVIQAFGASGANGTDGGSNILSWKMGGLGAKLEGTFHLKKRTGLKILVGQMGHRTAAYGDRPGGGGGGSFVTLIDNTPLIVAGGGGGGSSTGKSGLEDGDPGQATENGTRCGGTGGTGGQVCNTDTGKPDKSNTLGGGGGLKGDGGGGGIATVALSFVKGGIGGECPVSNGGFGGGGFAFVLGGGGGGYSGGGVAGTTEEGAAGGGGSYNSGTYQQNTAGVNEGDGKVVVSLIV